jgi:hypothetical protein
MPLAGILAEEFKIEPDVAAYFSFLFLQMILWFCHN